MTSQRPPGSAAEQTRGKATEGLLDRAVDHALAHLAGLGDRHAAAEATPAELRTLLDAPLPVHPTDPAEVIDLLAEAGRRGTVASPGPRYFGFVIGGSLPVALAADWMVSAWDQNAAAYTPGPAASVIEEVCARWLVELYDLPRETSVGFVTGGQMATFTGLAAARHHLLDRHGWDVSERGLSGAPEVTVLASAERHASVDRALRFLGFGSAGIRDLACDADGAVDPAALRGELERTRSPAIVCLQAGNINTGAVDPIAEASALAREHAPGAWVHVDGAIGLWAAASRRLRPAGLELADSWSTDAHKWLNVPFDCGIALCAHPASHRAAMGISAVAAPYVVLSEQTRDQIDWNPEWSRRARSVPVYAALRALGRDGVAELVERTCELARRFAAQLGGVPGVEVLNRVLLNQVLVAFRADDGDHDTLTRNVVEAVQREGTCWLGGTVWRGRYAMRISVSNWSTTEDDVDRSVQAIMGALRQCRRQ
ncbi:pyridoxal phosphate-dependent decarboxylase family protein [Nonomuraea sp. LPB2021202275-12-8]|uniref:pyridoxal phosphate-dependent decarboxylase family protein n=1 Tax=Nonomuraea sp. LPB2021202275-12-8 TaxID=3120159 RepID=UPI00300CBFF7